MVKPNRIVLTVSLKNPSKLYCYNPCPGNSCIIIEAAISKLLAFFSLDVNIYIVTLACAYYSLPPSLAKPFSPFLQHIILKVSVREEVLGHMFLRQYRSPQPDLALASFIIMLRC